MQDPRLTLLKLGAAALAVVAVMRTEATPSVTIDAVRQRFPWNGLVDVGYTISGVEDFHRYGLEFTVRANGIVTNVTMMTTPYLDPDYNQRTLNGSYASVFDLSAVFPELAARGARVTASLKDLGPWPMDATGAAIGVLADVMAVDVSAGSDAATYPIAYYSGVDTGWFNCDKYKTDKIALRYVAAGDYVIGWTDPEDNDVPRQTVSLGHPFYVGIFEYTQRQYRNVAGSIPSQLTTGDKLPAGGVSWALYRGYVGVNDSPAADSFFGKMSARAQSGSGASPKWDFPTEVQWEIAARGGSLYKWPGGDTSDSLGDYSWYKGNTSVTLHEVGLKLPNGYGVFDITGNVWEWCRDIYVDTFDGSYVETANAAEVSEAVHSFRGGGVCDVAASLAFSARYDCSRYTMDHVDLDVGCRPFAFPQ